MKKLNFRLYVAGQSPNSVLAVNNLEQFCATLPEDSYDIEIIDVLARPKLALAAEILVTPTLELTRTGTVRRVVGTLSNSGALQSLLPRLAI